MAVRSIRNISSEIADTRSRLLSSMWSLGMNEVSSRFFQLDKLLDSISNIDEHVHIEIYRHIILSAVSALQTFHVGCIVTIVDYDKQYSIRAAKIINEKIPVFEAIDLINNTNFTLGELFGHAIKCNSLDDLMIIGSILDCNIKEKFSYVISPIAKRNKKNVPPIVNDVQELFSDLSEVFRMRHILAHEAAPQIAINLEKCLKLFNATKTWVRAIDALFWETLYANEPLTQGEMNEWAFSKLKESRNQLAKTLRRYLRYIRDLKTESKSDLRKNYLMWSQHIKSWVRTTYYSQSGSMWPSIGMMDLSDAIIFKNKQIQNFLDSQTYEI